ncbi:RNase HII [Anaerobacterium chartisolvens]|uniref:Ribonuclease HII n=1 Tax=Anaerobacterium chartisolvens TaxID=1297424 RepID=A0A369BES0_9FIRM|nr:ribonuclease HII [Anaerobacterium chartisolvens]RCX20043.1 RNase HII [Anaerobacterium chartisolvens]
MSDKFTVKYVEEKIRHMTPDDAVQYIEDLRQNGNMRLEKLLIKYLRKKEAHEKELDRLRKMRAYEDEAASRGFKLVAGIDEAGRGPLAGPVVAAAVILPENAMIEGINDSKQVSAAKRDALFDIIKEKAVCYGIGIADEKCIDEINILNATKKAMGLAVEALKPAPDFLLIDAVELKADGMGMRALIKGDCLSMSIAAASILAKVTRDRIIDGMDRDYPQYGFSKHKGYGTREHIEAIKKFGICPIHRISFTKNFVG